MNHDECSMALETREKVPPQNIQENQRRITCLGEDIRVQWNCAICDYMEAAPLKTESPARSPSPLLDLLRTSNTDSLSPAHSHIPYRASTKTRFGFRRVLSVSVRMAIKVCAVSCPSRQRLVTLALALSLS